MPVLVLPQDDVRVIEEVLRVIEVLKKLRCALLEKVCMRYEYDI